MAVTIRDVAKLAGTSASAVSATLNGKNGTIRVGAATRERIYSAAAQLGYVSNPIAKSLATGKSRVIGLMLPYADAFVDQNPFCAQVMNGVLCEAVARHYNLMLYTAAAGNELDQLAPVVDLRIAGLVLVMPPRESGFYQACERQGIPHVSIVREPEEDDWVVNCDDFRGGQLAAEHLIELGHRRIGHLAGNPDVSTSGAREAGFRSAMAAAGLDVPDESVVVAGFDWRMGVTGMTRLLDLPAEQRPTAVFCANDLCAEGAIRAIHARGLEVPNDVAVVGFDDTWFASMVRPALTSVKMPIQEMGGLAARMVIDRIEQQPILSKQPVLPVSLTVRHSCGSTAALTREGTTPFHPVFH